MTRTEYAKMTREQARSLDEDAWSVMDEAQTMGWQFRRGSKGHYIGRAPDGKATMAVSPKTGNARAGRNMRAEFERWKRGQLAEPAMIAAAGHEILDNLTIGHARAAMEHALDSIVADQFPAGSNAAETFRTLTRLMMDNDEFALYMGRAIRSKTKGPAVRMPSIMTWDLDAASRGETEKPWEITETTRPWRVQWIAVVPDTDKIVAFGGPQMTSEFAHAMLDASNAHDARVKALARQAALDATTITQETTVKMHVCTECDKHFENPSRLKGHMTSTHMMVECEFCGRVTKGPGPAGVHRKRCEQNPDRVLTAKEKIAAAVEKGVQSRLAALEKAPGPITPATTYTDPTGALDALMAVLADYDRLRALDTDALQAQIAALTTERDQLVKELGEANTRLTMLREALGA